MLQKFSLGMAPTVAALTRPKSGSDPLSFLGDDLLAWWSADRTDLITLSGSQVTRWRDMVAAYDCVQTVSGSRPIFSATGFNGAPCITADGIDDHLTIIPTPAGIPLGSAPVEIWAIISQDLPAATTGERFAVSYGTFTNYRRTIGRGVGNVAEARSGTGTAEVSATTSSVELIGRHVIRSRHMASFVALSVNGSPETINTIALAATTGDRLRLFANSSGLVAGFWGGSARHYLFTRPLNDQKAAAMHAWSREQRRI